MNRIRVYAVASTLLFLGLQFAVIASAAEGGRVLTGELVVTDSPHNRFRLVGHDGSFAAPSGTSLHAFDGKPVQVELGHDGRVVEIREEAIHIEPITHGMEVLSGQLVVADAATRRFTIVGDTQTYVAPSRFDVERYAGRMVTVQLDEHERVIDIDLAPGASSPSLPNAPVCSYNGQGFSNGASVCQAGQEHRCEAGAWRSLGVDCSMPNAGACEADGVSYWDGARRCSRGTQFVCDRGQWRNLGGDCTPDAATAARAPRTCVVGDATVAVGSSICRSGSTYRCEDGGWVSDGTPCR